MVAILDGLIEEPVLDRRKRHRPGHGPLIHWRRTRLARDRRQRLDRLMLEHEPWREPEPGLRRAGDDLEAQDRVAAKGKEIVVDADAIEPQHLGPEPGENCFGPGA